MVSKVIRLSCVNSCKKDTVLELGIKFRQQIIRRIKWFLSLYVFKSHVFKSFYLPFSQINLFQLDQPA